ncbi:polycomb protein Sfmbt-like isoform X2 [Neocloeon triangulifer]|uniref:polycomb protein Sfmbt-like isoform X2 n=1 Tax=Neocloeon triangulifer TaxID=2078957 RepID=UPI00286F1B80|nr:polycomb protein Sfmbt-like isoform X2 [Neocloeon triangulifer]
MEMATPDGYQDVDMSWMRDHFLQTSESGNKMLIAAAPEQIHQYPAAQVYTSGLYVPPIPPNYEMDDDQNMAIGGYIPVMFSGEEDYENYSAEHPSCKMNTSTTSTQTFVPAKKIKPVKHPGLKLKTPIAYQKDSDLSVIPIVKEGMAVCEKCGAIGVKHAFYTRERRFCSLECARGEQKVQPEEPETTMREEEISQEEYVDMEMLAKRIPKEPAAPTPPPPPPPPSKPQPLVSNQGNLPPLLSHLPLEDPPLPIKRKGPELANTYEWKRQLEAQDFAAAPVTCFKHTPLSDLWDNIVVGMKVEVENTDCENFSEGVPASFWVATVLRIAGYKALLRYEGFGPDPIKDFWVNLCAATVHPVGWCAGRGKPLIPPKTIQNKFKDWKQFLVKRLTGARTLPTNFIIKIYDSLKSRFTCGLTLEVVDGSRISQVKVATISKIVGKRLHIKYYDDEHGSGFWCHEDSPLIHPVGWALKTGHNLDADPEYISRCQAGVYLDNDAGPELFAQLKPFFQDPDDGDTHIQPGMKLEAIDPLNLSAICVATVMRVLNDGYIMIRIDSYDPDTTGADWFCYHSTSPYIFPAGFCEMNSIPLTPPQGYAEDFDWDFYLKKTGAIAVPLTLFNCVDMETPPHSFIMGMKLECADLMDPRMICVGTISRVVGRLLKIHFDGWEDEYDQWLDCESPDMYPVGWCELVGHKLEGPRPSGGLWQQQALSDASEHPSINPASDLSSVKKISPKRGRGRKPKQKKLKIALIKKPTLKESPPSKKSKLNEVGGPAESPKDASQSPSYWEPEMAEEPAGPDQSLPCSEDDTFHVSESGKFIPRLIDSSINLETKDLDPLSWGPNDVETFLFLNDCEAYGTAFKHQKIDGSRLLKLSQDEIMGLTGLKVGPSLKIHELIQQLKKKVNPTQERHKAALRKFQS